ncbi:retrotransposon protein [Hordeum vulgare]|nr:retrotransposon protein [Hordeum vulgare]
MISLVLYAGGSGSLLPIQCPVLSDDNYIVWAIKVEANLDADELCEVVVSVEDVTTAVIAKKDKPARLATLRDEFDHMRMKDSDDLDAYVGRISGMATRYAGLRATLDSAVMVKKLLDNLLDQLYAAVARIEQFCDVDKMQFKEALGRLKEFEERTGQRTQDRGTRGGDQLMLMAAKWAA